VSLNIDERLEIKVRVYEETQGDFSPSFSARSQNFQERLLALSYLSVGHCVFLFVLMEKLGSNLTDFHEILYLRT
jgi:hypothetical protein